jgi:hypothetical protein
LIKTSDAPWSEDPDPAEQPLSEAELNRLAKGSRRLLEKSWRENPAPVLQQEPWWEKPAPPNPPPQGSRRVDPINRLRSDKELIEQALRDNPGLTLETILAVAKHHGWGLDPTGVQYPSPTPTKPAK